MKKIMISARALLLVSLTSVALGGCVMDASQDDDADTADEATGEVEESRIKWPGGMTPLQVCHKSCNGSYDECVDTADANQCYDNWQECRRLCTIAFGPFSKI